MVSASITILCKPLVTKVLKIIQVLSIVWGCLKFQCFLDRRECSTLVFFNIGADEISTAEIE